MKKIIIAIISIPVLFILILAVNFIIFQNNAREISQGTPIIPKDTLKQALLVIDIQEATTGNHSDYTYYKMKSEEIINTINLLANASAKSHIPVIYVRSVIHDFLINILNDMYAPDSPGARFDERLQLVSDIIINKDRSDAFSNAALDSFLVKHGINKLVFSGLDLAECVNSTVLAADNRNYNICLIHDAVLAKSDSLKSVKLDEFRQSGFEVISSDEYFTAIQ